MRKRIYGFDLIRGLCALIVLIYHFFSEIAWYYPTWNTDFAQLLITLNCADWGTTAVFSFFMLSGATLIYTKNHLDTKEEVIQFYQSRLLRLFPAYLIFFFYQYFLSVFVSKDLLYGGKVQYLLEGLFGLNGYFQYLHPESKYPIVGEWFMGAIILIYLLYPLILYCYKRKPLRYALVVFLVGMAVMNSNFNLFQIFIARNLLTCLLSFYLGMLFMEYHEQIKQIPYLSILSFILFILIGYVLPNTLPVLVVCYGLSISFFLFLYSIADGIQKIHWIWKIVLFLSNISYALFIVQHRVVVGVLGYFKETSFGIQGMTALLGVSIVIGLILAWILTMMSQWITRKIQRKK